MLLGYGSVMEQEKGVVRMSILSTPSVSDHLSLDETIAHLIRSPRIDGIAEFGSRAHHHATPASDYDLLILVSSLPASVFQLVTAIDHRLADIVLVETQTADTLLASEERPTSFFEELFAQKMQTAHIQYHRPNRLTRVQQHVTSSSWQAVQSEPPAQGVLHTAWFWQSFGLLQLERMARSDDPLHLSAVDMMLTACLSGTWRSYFATRALPWNGEKAALRYWEEHDSAYLRAVKACLEGHNRHERLVAGLHPFYRFFRRLILVANCSKAARPGRYRIR